MIDSGINQIAIGTKHFAIKFVINAGAFPICMGFFFDSLSSHLYGFFPRDFASKVENPKAIHSIHRVINNSCSADAR